MGIIPDVDVALADQIAELTGLLAALTESDWDRPSPCEGWSVADVVLHLAQTNDMATASAAGRFSGFLETFTTGLGSAQNVDGGADLAVANERGEPGPAVRDRWQASADAMRDALAAADPHGRVDWVAGELSVRTLTTTRLAETWIHTGDVAHGVGAALVPSARLWHIARLAWRTLPYAFAGAGRELTGPVALRLRAPDGDDWTFEPDTAAVTTVSGQAEELCLVAARRVAPSDTALTATGPDATAVLDLIRTYA